MKILDIRDSIDPYYNLALEEVLFKQRKAEYCMLWQSANAIVVGKHQNTYAEINLDFVREKGIDIARRLSGGGAVYHDLGNVNFTFIKNGQKGKMIDFDQFLEPMIEALNAMGLKTYKGKRNEIMLDGKKISGNAEHTFKERVLHHGTLLFDSQLQVLIKSLRIDPFKYQDKAIKSVQSRVTNIAEYLPDESLVSFRQQLLKGLMGILPNAEIMSFPESLHHEVAELADSKYKSWDWIYGYSPKYQLHRKFKHQSIPLELKLSVKKGKIEEVQLEGDQDLNSRLQRLVGHSHNYHTLQEALADKSLGFLENYLF